MKVGFNKTALMRTGLGLFTRARRTVPGQGTWQTTLQPRDLDGDGEPEAYYDTELDISKLPILWDRIMNWHSANACAESLHVRGVKGWRLPAMIEDDALRFDFGYAETNSRTKVGTTVFSEMAHLFYETLGNRGLLLDTVRPPYVGHNGVAGCECLVDQLLAGRTGRAKDNNPLQTSTFVSWPSRGRARRASGRGSRR